MDITKMDEIPPEWKCIVLLTEDKVTQLFYGEVSALIWELNVYVYVIQ